MLSRVAAGRGSPEALIPASPATCLSHSKCTSSASSTARVASTISGPIPSPGIRVAKMRSDVISWLLSAVPETGGDPVDCHVDAARHPLVRSAGAVALDELHLKVVERIEVRHAISDGAREGRTGPQELLLPCDAENRLDGPIAFGRDAPEDGVAELAIRHELGVPR